MGPRSGRTKDQVSSNQRVPITAQSGAANAAQGVHDALRGIADRDDASWGVVPLGALLACHATS
ncbi:hypothetical protein BCAR13_1230050 [Paraburkholderia caribensis]|nr:hypothetical protein BCAR13_1230050 [Paraburkholderia caribensis]